MRSCRILVAVIALFLVPSMAVARGGGGGHGGGGHGGGHGGSSSSGHTGGGHSSGIPHASPSPHTGGQGGGHSQGHSPRAPAPKTAAPSHDSKPKTDAAPHKSPPPKSQVSSAKPPATKCEGCARDAHGRIQRSEVAKRDFMKQTGYPNGRPGYVVDHITPLAKGGRDVPSNMQWQTIAEARAKDKVERR